MIPKIVHVIWIGPRFFPYADFLESWPRHNPGWQVRLWTDENRPHLGVNEQIYRRLPAQAMRADLLRLHLLAEYGGLYSDADSTCLAPVDLLVEGRTLCAMTGNRGRAANGTLAATPGHPGMVALVEGARKHYEKLRRAQRGGRVWQVHDVFGGRYVRGVLDGCDDFVRWPRRLVCQRRDQGPDTVIVHNSANTWHRELGRKGKVRV